MSVLKQTHGLLVAAAPRPQLREDAGAAAAAAKKDVALLRSAPHGNHGENNNGACYD